MSEKPYVTIDSLNPQERAVLKACRDVFTPLDEARSWLIDNLDKIGVSVEERWQQILQESTPEQRGLLEASTRLTRDAEPYTVYCQLIEEGHSLCKHMDRLTFLNDNVIMALSTSSYENPLLAMRAGKPERVRAFLDSGTRYLTGKPLEKGFVLDADPHRAVVDMSYDMLAKIREEVATPLPDGTPEPLREKITAARDALDKALDSLQTLKEAPAKHTRPRGNSPDRHPPLP